MTLPHAAANDGVKLACDRAAAERALSTRRAASGLNRTATEAALFATGGAADGTGPWLRHMAILLDVHEETKVQVQGRRGGQCP